MRKKLGNQNIVIPSTRCFKCFSTWSPLKCESFSNTEALWASKAVFYRRIFNPKHSKNPPQWLFLCTSSSAFCFLTVSRSGAIANCVFSLSSAEETQNTRGSILLLQFCVLSRCCCSFSRSKTWTLKSGNKKIISSYIKVKRRYKKVGMISW